jgi:hypothetical protein
MVKYAIMIDDEEYYGGKTYIVQGEYYPCYGGNIDPKNGIFSYALPVKTYAGQGRAANAAWRLERKICRSCTVVEYNEGVE